MNKPKPLVAGNWKMNGLMDSAAELFRLDALVKEGQDAGCEILICPPFTQIVRFAGKMQGGKIMIGAQDCHVSEKGAHTGDISAEIIKDAGASHVIVGHSERRADHNEDNRLIREKTKAAWRAGLVAIVCVGETASEREAGETAAVVEAQLAGSIPQGAAASETIIAYEPVWAIGSGVTPTADDVEMIHGVIRAHLGGRFGDEGGGMRILYGGSVKSTNAAALMGIDNVDGALVGGASLKAEDFNGIIDAYR
jgi:triosephosphate isomerase (TIM)